MKSLSKNFLWYLLIAIILGEIGYSVFLGLRNENEGEKDPSASVEAGDVAVSVEGVNFGAISEEIKAIPQPDFMKDVLIPTRYPDFYREAMEKKLLDVRELLTERQYDFTQWFNLAILLENFDDYEGAEDVWQYLIKVDEQSPLYAGRLATLYHFSLKKYELAETWYVKAIGLDHKRVDLYHNLHDLYKFLYKKDTKIAIAVLREALGYNSDSLELLAIIAADYKEVGDIKNARKYYEEAIEAAIDQSNFGLAEQLKRDMETLSK